jgi:hypothetical protein
MDVSFTVDESWSAPFYELYVEVGIDPDELAPDVQGEFDDWLVRRSREDSVLRK